MGTIIEKNENAFASRYGLSLIEKWSMFDEDCRNSAVECISEEDDLHLSETFSFEKSDILRIIIGFGGRFCLRKILDDITMATRIVVWEPEEVKFYVFIA